MHLKIWSNTLVMLFSLIFVFESHSTVKLSHLIASSIATASCAYNAYNEYKKSHKEYELIQNNVIPYMAPNDPDNVKAPITPANKYSLALEKYLRISRAKQDQLWFAFSTNRKLQVWAGLTGISIITFLQSFTHAKRYSSGFSYHKP